MAVETRVCSKCGLKKSIKQYYWNTNKNNYESCCKDCAKSAVNRWRTNNRNEVNYYARSYYARRYKGNSEIQANRNIKSKYGITLDEKEGMVADQRNMCKICGIYFDSSKNTHLDHNHKSGVIRGILCNKCNTAIGLLKDDPKILANAMLYVMQDGDLNHEQIAEVEIKVK